MKLGKLSLKGVTNILSKMRRKLVLLSLDPGKDYFNPHKVGVWVRRCNEDRTLSYKWII